MPFIISQAAVAEELRDEVVRLVRGNIMSLTNVVSQVMRHAALARHRRQKTHEELAPQRPSVRPVLELLEDRTVLTTWAVTSPADSGAGSLRAVIAAAQSGDQIIFDDSLHGHVITLTSGQLALTKSLDIEGLGADQLAVSGNHTSPIFSISGGVTVTIAGLPFSDGRVVGNGTDALGGGLFNNGGDVTLDHVVIRNNVALAVDESRPPRSAQGGGL